MDRITILIRNVTRERLKQTGIKGQTHDDLINMLIEARTRINQDSLDRRFGTLQSSESRSS